MGVIEEVLERIKPTPEEEEEILGAAEDLLRSLRDRLPSNAEPMLVGSVAKGTFLRDADIDVFVLFGDRPSKEEMGRVVWEATEGLLEHRRMEYAEHPYVRGVFKGRNVDVVPCYRVPSAEQIISAVDRTPFHTTFVKENLPPEGRDEVRILKQFAKGIGVYGSELKTMGFSGYLLELLVIKFGSFLGVLEAASKWGPKTVLWLGERSPKKEFPERLVFADPTDPGRNAAAAVSETNYGLFILASRDFLRFPTLDFFFPPPKEIRHHKRGTHYVEVSLPRPAVVEDVLYPQIRKAVRSLIKCLEEDGFNPIDYEFDANGKVRILVEVERVVLPPVERHMGPPLWHPRALDFLNKWRDKALRGPYAQDGRLWVDRQRKITRIEEEVIKCAESASWGKNLDEVKGGIEIIVDTPSPNLIEKYLSKKLRWIK